MGILNSNQVLKGARTPAGEKTYVVGLVKDKGTQGVSGDTLTFTNLTVELDGVDFTATKAFDFGSLGTLVAPGKSYYIRAVPSYTEPTDRTAAEAAGLNYYVAQNGKGEAVAYMFFPSDVETALAAAGGVTALATKVHLGSATASEITVYNYYYETVERLSDPRYTMQPLMPSGYELVLGEVAYQDNSSKPNALLSKTKSEYTILTAQLGQINTTRLILTTAEANARYAGKTHLVKSAKGYTTRANAISDVSATAITTPLADNYTFTDTFVAVNEYTVPAVMDVGHTVKAYNVVNWLDKQSSSYLGRINPIYLDNQALVGSVRFPQPMPLSRLTYYADPLVLARVTLGGTSGSLTLGTPTYIFDNGFN